MNSILKVYNLPGRILAEFWYLWPKKGQTMATGRRRQHPLVHFLYSTVFYIIALIVITIALQAGRIPNIDRSQAKPVSNELETQLDSQPTERPAENKPNDGETNQKPVDHETTAKEELGPKQEATTFESVPVVQEIPSADDASVSEQVQPDPAE